MPKKTELKIPTKEEILGAVRTRDESRLALKKKVRIFYDFQELRMQAAGRTKKSVKRGEIDLCQEDQDVLEARSKQLADLEAMAKGDIEDHLESIPFYRDVLKGRYKGVAVGMCGVILSEFDIHKEDTASKMWAFSGLAPVKARRCKKCHIVAEEKNGTWTHVVKQIGKPPKVTKYCGKDELTEADIYDSGKQARPVKGQKLPYNAWLRSKMCGVMGPNLLKANSPWRKHYDDYKHRKQSAGWGINDGHRHQAAIRYMVKMVLLDLWKEWRAFEGLPVRPSYQEEYLHHTHSADDGGTPNHEERTGETATPMSPE